jgi:phosphatidylinositol alpha-1,6-mannosyltransferase
VLLCVSRLVPRKGQDVLIAAMPMIRRLAPEAALLLVGEGPYRVALEAAAATEPRGSVVFAGEVTAAELPAYYAACDVFLHPNRVDGTDFEGFGLVFLEAAAAGKPAIGGDSGGVPEAVERDVTGLLVDGADVGQVAEAIRRLATSPDLRQQMGRAGRARVERSFSWERTAAEVAALHTRLMSEA